MAAPPSLGASDDSEEKQPQKKRRKVRGPTMTGCQFFVNIRKNPRDPTVHATTFFLAHNHPLDTVDDHASGPNDLQQQRFAESAHAPGASLPA
jgi:hypothetical protein